MRVVIERLRNFGFEQMLGLVAVEGVVSADFCLTT